MSELDTSITVLGADQLEAVLATAGPKAMIALRLTLVEFMTDVMAASQEIVPVGKTGNLKASGQVAPPEIDESSVKVTAGYGGAASAYALIVHNMPENLKHPTKPGTHGHFLIDPLTKMLPGLEVRLAVKIEGMMSV